MKSYKEQVLAIYPYAKAEFRICVWFLLIRNDRDECVYDLCVCGDSEENVWIGGWEVIERRLLARFES